MVVQGLFALLHLSLEGSQSIVVAERVGCNLVLDGGSGFFLLGSLGTLGLALCAGFGTLGILEGAAVGEDDALAVLVELDNLELELFAGLSVAAVLLNEVLGRGEAFYTIGKLYDSALVEELDDGAFVNAAFSEDAFEDIPRILFELLVAERETTVGLVDFEDNYLDVSANLRELRGVLNLLRPGEVGDVDEAVNALFEFNEHTEVGEVANLGVVTRANGIFHLDVLPGVFHELLDAERHLAVGAVEREDDGFDFVAYLEEVLSRAQVLAPAHFADVDEAFYARSNLNECTVVGHDNHLALYLVAGLEVGIESVPGMGLELLETEGDALLLVVEVEDNDIELLVELDNLAGIADAAPREVGDMDEAVYAAKVDEYTIGRDVLDGTFEHLTLLELGDDLLLLSFEFGLDECLVRNNHILVFLVDLDDLELHGLANEYVVVADGLHVDLRAGEEGFDAEYIDNHTALRAALDVALDHFLVFQSLVDALPRLAARAF